MDQPLPRNPEAQVLFEAEIAYSRGEIDKVYENANYLLEKHSGFYSVVAAGMRLGLCAIYRVMGNDVQRSICRDFVTGHIPNAPQWIYWGLEKRPGISILGNKKTKRKN